MKFSSSFCEHQTEQIVEHSATKLFANPDVFAIKDNSKDGIVHTYIIPDIKRLSAILSFRSTDA